MPGHEGAKEDVELEDEISGHDEGKHRYQGGSRDENSECRPQDTGEDDVGDALGHNLGGEEADGTAGDEDGIGGDEDDDYGYKNHVDDDDANKSRISPMTPYDPKMARERVTICTYVALQLCRVAKYICFRPNRLCCRLITKLGILVHPM